MAPTIIRTLREQGYDGPVAGWPVTDWSGIIDGLEGVEHYAEDVYLAQYSYYPLQDAGLELKERYEATGEAWTDNATHYYLAPAFLGEALQAAGVVDDPWLISKAMEESRMNNPLYPGEPEMYWDGEAKFGYKHQLAHPLAMVSYKDGELYTDKVIMPSAATGD